MIIGAIDTGSNSVKLLIGLVKGDRVRPVVHRSAVTRLGGGVERTRRLSTASQERTIKVLRGYRKVCQSAAVERVVAVGTEAFRMARNGEAFAERIRKETGIPLRILTGREEAKLAFLGATVGRKEKRPAAVDIGGGSTEIMFGSPGKLEGAMSLGLGAVRLTEQCLKSDPPSLNERLTMLQKVHQELDRLPRSIRRSVHQGGLLLGIGGTCVNVARMVRPEGTPEGRTVSLDALEDILNYIAELPLARRRKVPGIDPERADIILAGARVMSETLRTVGLDSFVATIHGLRRGLLINEGRRKE